MIEPLIFFLIENTMSLHYTCYSERQICIKKKCKCKNDNKAIVSLLKVLPSVGDFSTSVELSLILSLAFSLSVLLGPINAIESNVFLRLI